MSEKENEYMSDETQEVTEPALPSDGLPDVSKESADDQFVSLLFYIFIQLFFCYFAAGFNQSRLY